MLRRTAVQDAWHKTFRTRPGPCRVIRPLRSFASPDSWAAADQIWIFVPLQESIKNFVTTIPGYPFQKGSSLSAAGINYDLFRLVDAVKQLEILKKQLENLARELVEYMRRTR